VSEVFTMRTLPDNPSLDHLRQQAKDLLAVIRSTRPQASLADAQGSLAEQYGFRTWPELKAEVDRRRVTAPPGDPAVASAIAAAFGLGDVAGPMLPVERRWGGHEWSLATGAGKWSVTELFEWLDADNAETEVALVEAALAAGVRAPKPVRGVSGRIVESIAGRNRRVHETLRLGPSPAKPIAPAFASSVGAVLATLHRLALPAPGPINPWLTSRRSESDWKQRSASATSAGLAWAPRLAEELPTLLDVATIVDEDESSPAILSRCGLEPGSVRSSGGDGLVVVDW
jgi:hypothetical protein